MGRKGSFEGHVEASPDDVFATITDVARLSDWNDRIQRVVEHPNRLEPDAQWVVGMKIMGQRFKSRSCVLAIDPAGRRFEHRSNPEGDPDFAIWSWEVVPEGTGSRVTVTWDLNPVLWINRTFFVRVRLRQLKKELAASLAALEQLVNERSEVR